MATHSSTLAWKILWMEESGRLQSMALVQELLYVVRTFTRSQCWAQGGLPGLSISSDLITVPGDEWSV